MPGSAAELRRNTLDVIKASRKYEKRAAGRDRENFAGIFSSNASISGFSDAGQAVGNSPDYVRRAGDQMVGPFALGTASGRIETPISDGAIQLSRENDGMGTYTSSLYVNTSSSSRLWRIESAEGAQPLWDGQLLFMRVRVPTTGEEPTPDGRNIPTITIESRTDANAKDDMDMNRAVHNIILPSGGTLELTGPEQEACFKYDAYYHDRAVERIGGGGPLLGGGGEEESTNITPEGRGAGGGAWRLLFVNTGSSGEFVRKSGDQMTGPLAFGREMGLVIVDITDGGVVSLGIRGSREYSSSVYLGYGGGMEPNTTVNRIESADLLDGQILFMKTFNRDVIFEPIILPDPDDPDVVPNNGNLYIKSPITLESGGEVCFKYDRNFLRGGLEGNEGVWRFLFSSSGSGGGGVQNPMTESLDANYHMIENVGTLTFQDSGDDAMPPGVQFLRISEFVNEDDEDNRGVSYIAPRIIDHHFFNIGETMDGSSTDSTNVVNIDQYGLNLNPGVTPGGHPTPNFGQFWVDDGDVMLRTGRDGNLEVATYNLSEMMTSPATKDLDMDHHNITEVNRIEMRRDSTSDPLKFLEIYEAGDGDVGVIYQAEGGSDHHYFNIGRNPAEGETTNIVNFDKYGLNLNNLGGMAANPGHPIHNPGQFWVDGTDVMLRTGPKDESGNTRQINFTTIPTSPATADLDMNHHGITNLNRLQMQEDDEPDMEDFLNVYRAGQEMGVTDVGVIYETPDFEDHHYFNVGKTDVLPPPPPSPPTAVGTTNVININRYGLNINSLWGTGTENPGQTIHNVGQIWVDRHDIKVRTGRNEDDTAYLTRNLSHMVTTPAVEDLDMDHHGITNLNRLQMQEDAEPDMIDFLNIYMATGTDIGAIYEVPGEDTDETPPLVDHHYFNIGKARPGLSTTNVANIDQYGFNLNSRLGTGTENPGHPVPNPGQFWVDRHDVMVRSGRDEDDTTYVTRNLSQMLTSPATSDLDMDHHAIIEVDQLQMREADSPDNYDFLNIYRAADTGDIGVIYGLPGLADHHYFNVGDAEMSETNVLNIDQYGLNLNAGPGGNGGDINTGQFRLVGDDVIIRSGEDSSGNAIDRNMSDVVTSPAVADLDMDHHDITEVDRMRFREEGSSTNPDFLHIYRGTGTAGVNYEVPDRADHHFFLVGDTGLTNIVNIDRYGLNLNQGDARPSTPSYPNVGQFWVDGDDVFVYSGGADRNLSTSGGGGGGVQNPMESNLNAAGFNITGIGLLGADHAWFTDAAPNPDVTYLQIDRYVDDVDGASYIVPGTNDHHFFNIGTGTDANVMNIDQYGLNLNEGPGGNGGDIKTGQFRLVNNDVIIRSGEDEDGNAINRNLSNVITSPATADLDMNFNEIYNADSIEFERLTSPDRFLTITERTTTGNTGATYFVPSADDHHFFNLDATNVMNIDRYGFNLNPGVTAGGHPIPDGGQFWVDSVDNVFVRSGRNTSNQVVTRNLSTMVTSPATGDLDMNFNEIYNAESIEFERLTAPDRFLTITERTTTGNTGATYFVPSADDHHFFNIGATNVANIDQYGFNLNPGAASGGNLVRNVGQFWVDGEDVIVYSGGEDRNLSSGGGGGVQNPMTEDLDADGHMITGLDSIMFETESDSDIPLLSLTQFTGSSAETGVTYAVPPDHHHFFNVRFGNTGNRNILNIDKYGLNLNRGVVLGGNPTRNVGQFWINGSDVMVYSGGAIRNLSNSGGGGGVQNPMTEDLEANEYGIDDVNNISFDAGPGEYLHIYNREAGSPNRKPVYESISGSSQYFRVGNTDILTIQPTGIFLGDPPGSGPGSAVNGQMWRNGSDVWLHTGGNTRNLSTIGGVSNPMNAPLDADHEHINEVGRMTFRESTQAQNDFLVIENNDSTSDRGVVYIAPFSTDHHFFNVGTTNILNIDRYGLNLNPGTGNGNPTRNVGQFWVNGEDVMVYSGGEIRNLSSGGGGGVQNPMTADLDADDHFIENLEYIDFNGSSIIDSLRGVHNIDFFQSDLSLDTDSGGMTFRAGFNDTFEFNPGSLPTAIIDFQGITTRGIMFGTSYSGSLGSQDIGIARDSSNNMLFNVPATNDEYSFEINGTEAFQIGRGNVTNGYYAQTRLFSFPTSGQSPSFSDRPCIGRSSGASMFFRVPDDNDGYLFYADGVSTSDLFARIDDDGLYAPNNRGFWGSFLLLNSTTRNPLSNGDFVRDGNNVLVRSGNANRNLSNVSTFGAGTDADSRIWSMHNTPQFNHEIYHTNSHNHAAATHRAPLQAGTHHTVPIYVDRHGIRAAKFAIHVTQAPPGNYILTWRLHRALDNQNYPGSPVGSPVTAGVSGTGLKKAPVGGGIPHDLQDGLYFLTVTSNVTLPAVASHGEAAATSLGTYEGDDGAPEAILGWLPAAAPPDDAPYPSGAAPMSGAAATAAYVKFIAPLDEGGAAGGQ